MSEKKLLRAIFGRYPKTDQSPSEIEIAARAFQQIENPDILTARERSIIESRQKHTIEEIGEMLKISQERIRIIEAKAKRKLSSTQDKTKHMT